IPGAVADPASEIPDAPSDGVSIGGKVEPPDLGLKLGRDFLVGVDRKHPGRARLLERELLLLAVAQPLLRNDPRAGALRRFERAVGAPRIDDDDFLREEAHARQTAPQIPLLV